MKSKSALDRCIAVLAIAAFALSAATNIGPASAQTRRNEPAQFRPAGTPILAIVALSDQRVTIYDANGKMLQSPVSTGATGYETPAGIYSVVQKNEFHQSNVYEDGNMPFMQRITWTGIALHAGVLPGHPASHGCVRMPLAFAERLFGLTDIGLRVIVVRDDIVPTDIAHPVLFKPNPARREPALAAAPVDRSSGGSQAARMRVGAVSPEADAHLQMLKSIAAAKAAEAEAATRRATEIRQAAARKAAEAAPAARMARAAEGNLARVEAQLKTAERQLEIASSPANPPDKPKSAEPPSEKAIQAAELARERAELAREKAKQAAELAKERAVAKLAEAMAQLEAAKAQEQAKADAATRASEEAKLADAARDAAVEVSDEARRKTLPVSVFISRKAQRYYVRQAHQPAFEGPIAIRDADKPIGTYVFTALSHGNNAEVKWSVVSMYKSADAAQQPAPQGERRRGEARHSEPVAADVAGATAALDRVTIPRDALDRISEVVLPGSSLIISDEGASIETGKDTDFVVLMSGEPQGGIKVRQREPRYRNDDFFGGPKGFPFFWN